jgi:hypothetical protein
MSKPVLALTVSPVLLAATLSTALLLTPAQTPSPAGTLALLSRLVGEWRGSSEGQPECSDPP